MSDVEQWVDVAVPRPLSHPLTYEVPLSWSPLARRGARARVPLGRRQVVGVIVKVHPEPPEGMTLRRLVEILDPEPILTPELLRLASFAADYYLAPIGEVLRCMVPPELEPWSAQRLRVTNAGALAPPRDPEEAAVIAHLLDRGPRRLAALQEDLGLPDLRRVMGRLLAAGKVALKNRPSLGKYRRAVELAPGDVDELLARCGRSTKARKAVRYVHALERPATLDEVCDAVGCTSAVLRRLIAIDVFRSFTQVERLSMDRHLMAPRPEAAIDLRGDQQEALSQIHGALGRGTFATFLLSGITGSGKTEVYLRAAQQALAAGRGVLLLVPEIALVPALARTVQQRFGPVTAILHSAMARAERRQEWQRVRSGEARLVLGPRSALFAPVEELGLVVVDEEQDPSYKQDIVPRYHGRDLALVRAQRAGAVAVLASATPSLESRHNVEIGKLREVRLTRRVGEGGVPEGILVDLRQEEAPRRPGEIQFSGVLRQHLEEAISAGEQIILLRNRRGYAPLFLCRACGEDHRCSECGLPRTFHRRQRYLLCHYCGSTTVVPELCGACGKDALQAVGAGTERVEERFSELFPGVPVDVLDRDATRRLGGAAAVLERFSSGATRVLIGTQMVAKGHHFPNVGLAAVLSADTYLSFPDFRAVERTYNLLVQLAGRAGRGDRPGRVVIQTYHPEHYAIRAALANDDAGFAAEEMRFRRIFHYPPYTRMIQVLVTDRNRERAGRRISELGARLDAHPSARGVRVLGPAPAPLERLRSQWRFQILLRAESGRRIRRLVEEVVGVTSAADVVIDVDPLHLM